MTLQDRIVSELKDALRQGDAERRSVLRMLRSAIHYEEIATGHPLDDEGVISVVSKQVRQHRESITAYEAARRPELVARETSELDILMHYLPQQLSREELVDLARKAIQEVGAQGPQDHGKVMGCLMPQVKGRVEGSEANILVKELLAAMAGS